ncbi:MAG TPA: beta-propeller fold lactonase family protein [Candidatus Binataceae bacterium]|nr:beta-propeller fold lactonase family protein [Candidatus Binataceae bacterium]
MVKNFGVIFRGRARVAATLTIVMALAAGCGGRTFFSGTTSSSSGGGGGGGGTGTTRSVYVTNFADGKLSALSNSSGVPANPRTIRSGKAGGPLGLAAIPSKALYVANSADNEVHEFALTSNGNLSALGTITAGTNPQQVLVTTDGTAAYAINSSGSISQYIVNASGALTANTPASTTSNLTTPISGVLSSSTAYITDQGGGGVVSAFAINTDGTLGTLLSSTLTLGIAGGKPAQITMDTTGSWVFVADATSGVVSVFAIQSNGSLLLNSQTTALGVAAAGLVFAVTPNGNAFLYVATPSLNAVQIYAFAAGILTFSTSATGFAAPIGLAVDNALSAANLFVTNSGSGTVTGLSIDSTTGLLASVGSSATENPSNGASSPQFIVVTS